MSEVERHDWIERAMERADALMTTLDDPGLEGDIARRRIMAWNMRLKGFSCPQIAEKLGVSYGTAYQDVRWCLDNLPAAYDTVEDFRNISLARLDEMIQQLASDDDDDGDDGAPPSVDRIKTRSALIEHQAKLLGAMAPTKVQADTTIRYEVVGVDSEVLR